MTQTNQEIPDETRDLIVKTGYISDFLNSNAQISLPDYQRPYVWTEEKLEQLLTDFDEHFYKESNFQTDSPDYYLGTVLLYCKSQNQYEIIDGQQRISTLLIIDYAWNEENSFLKNGKWNLEYTSLISSSALKQNYAYIKNHPLQSKYSKHIQEIFKKLIITVIITNSEDESFTFFDSQNNRGVSLSAVDFLKSYHLRELKGNENLQKRFAQQWDKNNKSQFLQELFNLILWRSRAWKGKELYYEYKDVILNTFQKETIKEEDNEIIRLYPNVFNSLAKSLTFDEKSGISITPNNLNLQTTAEQYPFSIRQPLQRGIGFFLYTEKYHAVYNVLFKEKRFSEFTHLYETLYNGVSYYLKTFFKLATITYYDKFKDHKLVEFGLWLDYLLGSYRIEQYSIQAQTVIKILRDNPQNLIDVIEMAYRPEDIFKFIRSITHNECYDKKIEDLNNPRKTYRKNNIEFYGKNENDSLENKLEWIYEYISK